jgi:hypothetical protein
MGRALVVVRGREALLDAMKINLQGRDELVIGAFDDVHATTPGKELGIIFDFGNEVEHLFCAIAKEN